jgi:hypothetical protein
MHLLLGVVELASTFEWARCLLYCTVLYREWRSSLASCGWNAVRLFLHVVSRGWGGVVVEGCE